MGDVVVPREGPLSWRPSKALKERLVAAASERGVPLGRLVEELCWSGLASSRVAMPTVRQFASNDLTVHGYPPLVEKPARGPAEVKMPTPLREAVAATGVVVASEVEKSPPVGDCPRAHYHRPGRYCTTCGKSY